MKCVMIEGNIVSIVRARRLDEKTVKCGQLEVVVKDPGHVRLLKRRTLFGTRVEEVVFVDPRLRETIDPGVRVDYNKRDMLTSIVLTATRSLSTDRGIDHRTLLLFAGIIAVAVIVSSVLTLHGIDSVVNHLDRVASTFENVTKILNPPT